MIYDFDEIIDRRNIYSMKYDMTAYGKSDDTLPLWIADMDFQSPPCVLNALTEQIRHGIFGYFDTGESYFQILQNWFSQRFGWETERSWLVKTSGVVSAVHVAILALTNVGNGVIVQQPVYYPLSSAVRKTGRRLVVNELLYKNNRYLIDFDDFEKKIIQNDVKLFILCSPHNPVGRVWTRGELTRLGDICIRHGVVVISDEIHQDFVYDGNRHHVFAGLGVAYGDIAVTCTAPTKTFNLAGLPLANIFISNERMREKFLYEYARFGAGQIGVMGVAACQAAYQNGAVWLEELLRYLSGNMAIVRDFLMESLPEIKFIMPEGTYLIWLDFRGLGLDENELDALITHKARLWLHSGSVFGSGGAGFMRMNIACPRSILCEALERLEKAVREQVS